MPTRRSPVALVLAILLAAVVAGLVWTRERKVAPPAGESTTEAAVSQRPRARIVNMQPLLTARRVAALAQTTEEQELARQAVRIADHVVDLALAESIRRITEEPPPPTPEIRTLAEARAKAQAALGAAEQRVQALTARAAAAQGLEKDRLEDQLELARAQQELAQDDLDAASEKLAKVGGDPQALIQRLRTAYDAAQKEQPLATATGAASTAAPAGPTGASLLARVRAWNAQRAKRAAIGGARDEAAAAVTSLTARIERVNKRIADAQGKVEAAQKDGGSAAEPAASEPAAARTEQSATAGETRATATTGGTAATTAPATAAGAQKGGTAAAALHDAARDRRRLVALTKRLEDQQELAEVYGEWVERVEGQVRAALRLVLLAALWLVFVGALGLAAVRLIDRAFPEKADPQARTSTLRMLARLGVQVCCLAAAVFTLFGTPSQATTILGLAGAGLTVAMKDFIVAFFGWFVLMGRNGIRVGDWVEIQGVGGEVAEIGLFHTVLLETGSWSDAGHPTGRRVSFVNSFAIERHYFNFSTSGQWMWDELHAIVPPGQDPYPIIDGVQKLVEQQTRANAELAEQEWRRTTTRYRVRTFSAVPGINVVPSASGVELVVRFITRAYERHAARQRLSQAIVELMHKRAEPVGPGTSAA